MKEFDNQNSYQDDVNVDDMDSTQLDNQWTKMAESLRKEQRDDMTPEAGATMRAIKDDEEFEAKLKKLHEEKQRQIEYRKQQEAMQRETMPDVETELDAAQKASDNEKKA